MSQYHKTQLGLESLKQRSMDLNARQRRLLLLIGTEDFNLLNEQFKRRIASAELLQQLLDMGLITYSAIEQTQTTVSSAEMKSEIETSSLTQNTPTLSNKFAEPISTTVLSPSLSSIVEPISQLTAPQNEIEVRLDALSFEEVKQLMAQRLQQNCGLMAKQLINRILQTQDLRNLKLCQMQWITELQESRISAHDLNQCLKQINFSLQKLNAS